MKQTENEMIEKVLDEIRDALIDPESPLFIERIKTHQTLEDGTILLDKNDPQDRAWFEDDSATEQM